MLPYGTLLRNQYLIGNVLGNPGGFGITYLGYNQKLECKVAIKEFLPREIAGRSIDGIGVEVHAANDAHIFAAGLEQFLQEARLLAKFAHANIVRVIDFFEENGTAYLVMDYYSGVTLVEYVERNGGSLSQRAALEILLPIFDGLREIHARGILHRDIKPQNIYITTQGRPILLDFGAARQTVEALSQGFSLLITPGFAPIEQYDRQGKQGPWTDVYGCAATLYYMLTGHAPPDAVSRMTKDSFQPAIEAQTGSPGLLLALEKGLALLPENRLSSIAEFQEYLSNETIRIPKSREDVTQLLTTQPMLHIPQRTAAAGSEETAELPSEPARLRPVWRNPKMKIWLLVLAVVIGIGVWYFQHTPVNQLTQKGIPFTEQAFFQAVRTDNQEVVKLFLAAGYKPDHAAQDTGETAVMAAIEAGQFPMVNYLIAQGASLDRKDYQGRKPMDIALKQGNIQILKLLMDQQKRGPDSKDEHGRTLLEQAILAGNMNSVKFVIEQGAAINTEDIHGNTLLDQMLAAGNQPVAQLLKSLGAKRNVNKDFVRGQLNEIKVPPGDTTGFEIDLLGNGLGQQITLTRQNSSRGTVAISQDGRLLAEYGNFRSQRWYAANLRDDNTPDLIYFRLVGSDFIEEIKIIGRTGKETIGLLFAPDLGMLRSMGLLHGQAGIQLEGKQLIVYSGKNRAVVEWSPEQQSFRMRKL
ncbi:protein kinase domain-containing protein [Anaerosporomusa subterranea]|uniref:protein kinase domain-containing protein n=1 Tax=Anaerosporomusa subterranea TaxID=1794912 RepID=UPI0018D380DF|nr:ankyrin repeat domain-containing protein [Anaerosporomusa subterranea]